MESIGFWISVFASQSEGVEWMLKYHLPPWPVIWVIPFGCFEATKIKRLIKWVARDPMIHVKKPLAFGTTGTNCWLFVLG